MHKLLIAAGLVLIAGTPALAQQAAPPELAGVASAREGVKAERLAFEYFKTAPDALISVAKITVAPGQFIPMHTHSGPEFHYVVAGALEETSGSEPPRTLKAGEGHYAAGNVPHSLKNTGKEPATFIAFIAGKKGERLTVPFKK
jgi:quercetin dioxygenase-like cupin family protein